MLGLHSSEKAKCLKINYINFFNCFFSGPIFLSCWSEPAFEIYTANSTIQEQGKSGEITEETLIEQVV